MASRRAFDGWNDETVHDIFARFLYETKTPKTWGCGRGSVGSRAVESSHREIIITINCIKRQIEEKEPVNGRFSRETPKNQIKVEFSQNLRWRNKYWKGENWISALVLNLIIQKSKTLSMTNNKKLVWFCNLVQRN